MGHSNGEDYGPAIPPWRGIFKRRSILFRTAMLSGIVTVLALGLFILFLIPYQKSMLIGNYSGQKAGEMGLGSGL